MVYIELGKDEEKRLARTWDDNLSKKEAYVLRNIEKEKAMEDKNNKVIDVKNVKSAYIYIYRYLESCIEFRS